MAGLLGSLFGGAKPPKPPDPGATADQQAQYARDMDTYNRAQTQGASGKTDEFGSVQYDPVTGAQTRTSAAGLNMGGLLGNFGGTVGQLPGTTVDYSTAVGTPAQIAQRNMDAYTAMTQQHNQFTTTMSDRGIPIGSEVWNNESGNMARANSAADIGAASTAWNAVPGMQGTMIANENTMAMQPYQQAGAGLGLLGGVNSLTPGYGGVYQSNAAAPDYANLVNANYAQQMKKYEADQASSGGLWKTLGGVAGMALGGPIGGMLGSAAGGLFNNGSMGAAG